MYGAMKLIENDKNIGVGLLKFAGGVSGVCKVCKVHRKLSY